MLTTNQKPTMDIKLKRKDHKHANKNHQVIRIKKKKELQNNQKTSNKMADFLKDQLVWSPGCPNDSQQSSSAPQF